MKGPLVSVVTVNYNGKAFLDPLLESLSAQTYRPTELIVVDNASTDGSVEHLRRRYPHVTVVASPANLGFCGGNNLGFRHSHGEYIALINNDAVAEPDWLAHLVADLEAHPQAGAVGSKITFFKRFVPLRIEASGAPVALEAASRFVDCDYIKPLYKAGWLGEADVGGAPGKWLRGEAELWLPVERTDAPARLALRLAALGGEARCSVKIGEHVLWAGVTPGAAPLRVECDVPPAILREFAQYVVNNAASRLDERGNAADRGIGEIDRSQYDRAEEVEALCGCAMIVRRTVVEATGGFDEAFFMYYEDTDLSWRIRKLGYRLRYQPGSVVRHRHAASTVEWSPFFVFHVARNRVLISLKNAPLRYAFAPLWTEFGRLFGCAARCAGAALRRGAVPGPLAEELRTRLRVQRSLLTTAPRMFAKRWSLR